MDNYLLDFIYRLGEFHIRLGLETTYKFLEKLGNPQIHPAIIHIAGTNGKGSILSFLERLLIDSGFKVCMTTSPHLLDYNERFRFQAKQISDAELKENFDEICEICCIDPYSKNDKNWLVKPTFFEFSIGLAFFWFKKKKPDYILLETGMGGRMDSTNAIPKSLACIFSPISLDHTEFLGNSLLEIAQEKFGIVKKKSLIISSSQENSVLKLLQDKFPNNEKTIFGNDFFLEKRKDTYFFLSKQKKWQKKKTEQTLEIPIRTKNKSPIKSPIKSPVKNPIKNPAKNPVKNQTISTYQLENIATALASYFSIVPPQKRLTKKKIASSLQKSHWPARLHYISKIKPTLLLDAAHNSQGIESLAKHLQQHHFKDKILCAIHWVQKKEIFVSLKKFSHLNIEFLPIDFKHSKAGDIASIQTTLKKAHLKTNSPQTLEEVIEKFLKGMFANYSIFLVTGSIYLLGDFYAKLNAQSKLFTKNNFYGF